jgi:uncharacterized protein (DUF924 family)
MLIAFPCESVMNSAEAILNFWFDNPESDSSEYGQQRKIWFKKDPSFDATIRQCFLEDYERAVRGELESWQQQPRPCLALILLFDQFPRNLFRGSAQSFATDPHALALANHALQHQFDQALIPVERMFVYLPFEHSENFADQATAVALFQNLFNQHPEFADPLDYAIRHRQVIEQFGRFPHRNKILGRETTPEEAEFLKQPGSRF